MNVTGYAGPNWYLRNDVVLCHRIISMKNINTKKYCKKIDCCKLRLFNGCSNVPSWQAAREKQAVYFPRVFNCGWNFAFVLISRVNPSIIHRACRKQTSEWLSFTCTHVWNEMQNWLSSKGLKWITIAIFDPILIFDFGNFFNSVLICFDSFFAFSICFSNAF